MDAYEEFSFTEINKTACRGRNYIAELKVMLSSTYVRTTINNRFFVSLELSGDFIRMESRALKGCERDRGVGLRCVLWGCYGRSCVVNKSLWGVSFCGGPWHYSERSLGISFIKHALLPSDDPPWALNTSFAIFVFFASLQQHLIEVKAIS